MAIHYSRANLPWGTGTRQTTNKSQPNCTHISNWGIRKTRRLLKLQSQSHIIYRGVPEVFGGAFPVRSNQKGTPSGLSIRRLMDKLPSIIIRFEQFTNYGNIQMEQIDGFDGRNNNTTTTATDNFLLPLASLGVRVSFFAILCSRPLLLLLLLLLVLLFLLHAALCPIRNDFTLNARPFYSLCHPTITQPYRAASQPDSQAFTEKRRSGQEFTAE